MIRSGGRTADEPSSPPRLRADHAWNHEIGATYRFWVMPVPEDYIEEKQGRCQTTRARCILIRIRKMAPSNASWFCWMKWDPEAPRRMSSADGSAQSFWADASR